MSASTGPAFYLWSFQILQRILPPESPIGRELHLLQTPATSSTASTTEL